jgi:hypothetical protein
VEQAVLARLCVAVDRAERIRAELADQPLLTRGSAGQPRSSPLLMAAEQADRTVDRLAGSLGVSMPDVGKPRAHQSKAQKTRWSRAAKSASVTPIKGA